MWRVVNDDICSWAKNYDGPLFHAIVCDPPYNLDTIKKRFGKKGSAPAKYGRDGAFQRASKGFMNKEWDTDIAFQPETWELIGNLLYPGAFCMAFGGSRTYHRMATAIENAGFIIHPMIGWIQGQGLPKATNLYLQLEKGMFPCHKERIDDKNVWFYNDTGEILRRSPPFRNPEADIWFEFRYGLQALKPSLEPICVFQKPYKGKPLDNIIKTGVGAMWIDGARIGNEEIPSNVFDNGMKPFGDGAGHSYTQKIKKGRWPANVVITHSPDCTEDKCVEGCGVKALDVQSGHLKSGKMLPRHKIQEKQYNVYGKMYERSCETIGDEGGASRFFYCAKASKKEKNAGLEGSDPTWKCTCGALMKGHDSSNCPPPKGNTHPTIKPIKLIKHLGTLLLPPDEYSPRRLLVPFSGTGSEMIGCLLVGWDEVTGVEIEKESCDIANKRLEYWIDDKKE